MKMFFVPLAFITAIASPAFAQSFDPSVGSGNIGGQIVEDNALDAYASSAPQPHRDISGRTILPYTLQEHRMFERAKGNVW